MVGNNPKEDILISCKATAMIYNDAQKKWLHCASNGPAKIQLLFAAETQTYRIVGRQIQDHEVVLNHSISKGIKYNQATPTFHQWRDQSSVYGLNFSSKLDAQEFGIAMMKILEHVNGSLNNSCTQVIVNGGATLPSSSSSSSMNNTNNNNNMPPYKRQSSQPPSTLPCTTTLVPINCPSTTNDTQQQQYSSSPYTSHMRQNSTSMMSATSSISNNNYYSQQNSSHEDDETNYALISDSYSYYGDNPTNKTSNAPLAPPLNTTTTTTTANGAPPPPPPPPPPLPNGFGNGQTSAPALALPNSNSVGSTNTARKSSTSNAPPMDLMSEMAAKFAQRRKYIDENEKNEANNSNNNKGTSKGVTSNLPPATPTTVTTSPRIGRKATETNYASSELEKLKMDILNELRKDIEKAKQEILNAIFDNQQHTKI